MNGTLWVLPALRVIGGFDTFYYHEWRARLPAQGRQAAPGLQFGPVALLIIAAGVFLSGARDLYAAFGSPYGHWPRPKSQRVV